jgi:UDP-glucose 4-epimerase
MAVLITGGAGFVSANLIQKFLDDNQMVIAVDNFSRGTKDNINFAISNTNFQLIECDLSNYQQVEAKLDEISISHEIEEVWHLAANSDIPAGVKDMDVDLLNTFMTTYNILKWMKTKFIGTIYFASSSAVYGDHGSNVLTESTGPLLPISNYGAMKLASEAQISAAAESFLNKAIIFRFPNVVGTPATHGVILDFMLKLSASPNKLTVLGDGSQFKSYLHVSELVEGMFLIRGKQFDHNLQVFNIGPENEDGIYVKTIAQEVVKVVSPSASIEFGTGNKGWVGDIPKFKYSIDKIKQLGWSPSMNSYETVLKAISEIKQIYFK